MKTLRRLTWVLIISATITLPVAAQSNCSNGLPCGPVPWSLPNLPALATPTRFPTVVVTATPCPTPLDITPGVPTPTPTEFLDLQDLEDQIATLSAIVETTPVIIENVDGGDFDPDSTDLAGNTEDLFGYIRGLSGVHFGPLTVPITFLLFALVFTLANEILFFVVSIGAAVFGFIRKVITLIMDFLPF